MWRQLFPLWSPARRSCSEEGGVSDPPCCQRPACLDSDRVLWIVAEFSMFNWHRSDLSMVFLWLLALFYNFPILNLFIAPPAPPPYGFTGEQRPVVAATIYGYFEGVRPTSTVVLFVCWRLERVSAYSVVLLRGDPTGCQTGPRMLFIDNHTWGLVSLEQW